tara:strand:+ start:325 stop:447 length:123 start_codon:yes stop_codon:yes gene_type:complete
MLIYWQPLASTKASNMPKIVLSIGKRSKYHRYINKKKRSI